jgi:uncharacterized protein
MAWPATKIFLSKVMSKRWNTLRGSIRLIIVVCLMAAAPAVRPGQVNGESAARISVLMATGMPGSTYYQAGLGMASLWTTKLRDIGIRVSGAISEGSIENIEAIRIADADVILAEDLFATMAHNGTGLFKGRPIGELRSITNLWPQVLHLLIRSDKVSTGDLQDLDELTASIELPDSGNRFITEMLLKNLKSGRHKIRWRPMSNLAAAEALKKGHVQGLDMIGGLPIPLVTALFSEMKSSLDLLEITNGQMDAIDPEFRSIFFRQVIPAGTYPGQNKNVNTVAQMSVLCVAASLDPQVVYALTKALYENLEYLAKVHPACKSISLDKALEGLTVPLHKGAIRYYKERKIKIPDNLIP